MKNIDPATRSPTGTEMSASKSANYTVGTLTYTKAGLFVLCGWLLWGDFCFTLFESIGGPGILGLYLQDNFHVSNLQVNIIFSVIPNLIGVIVGPILSFKSDRYRSRLGRRIPFILWTTPFLCLFAAAIGYADEIVSFAKAHVATGGLISPFMVAMLLISFLVIGFSFFNEFVNTVYWYLFADVVPAHFMGRFMGLFRMVGAAAGFLINVLIAAHQLTHMRLIHVSVAALYFVGFALMCWRVREGEYPPVTDVTEKTTFGDQVRLYLRECFTQPIFIMVYLATFAFTFARAAGISGVFALHLGQHVAVSAAHQEMGRAVAMTPAGDQALTAGADSRVKLWHASRIEKVPGPFWDAVRRAKLPALGTLAETGPAATAVALALAGTVAVVGDADGGIRLWRIADRQTVTNLAGHAGAVLALAVSRDGSRLASAGVDRIVRLWDLPSGRCLHTLPGHTGDVRSVAFSSDGLRLVSGGMDGQLRVYDAQTGTLVRVIDNGSAVYAVTFTPALVKLERPSVQGPAPLLPINKVIHYVKNVFSNESLYDIPADQRSRVAAENGWLVAGGQDDGGDSRNAKLRIWDAAGGEAVMALKGHKQAITSVQYKPDLHLLVSGSLDGSARLWNPVDISPLASDQSLKTLSGYMDGVTALAVTDRGNRIVCLSASGNLHLWNLDAGVSLRKTGLMASFFGIIGLLLAYPLGALVDRFHALRSTLLASLLLIPVPFLSYCFVHDYMAMVWIEAYKAPIFGLVGAAGMPLLIAIFPKDKFGQMCSANGLVKQASALVLGLIGAVFMDWVTQKTMLTDNFRYGALWMGTGFVIYAFTIWGIYRHWLKLGGDKNYRPPESNGQPMGEVT